MKTTEQKEIASTQQPIEDLLELMVTLRNPDSGCPWDIKQDFKSIAPHTIEEAYEVADAIEHGDMDDIKDELGDLLFQVVFHAQLAKEQGAFDFVDVVTHITEKMVHRHPHVFGDEVAENADQVENEIWERRKALEKGKQKLESVIDNVPVGLPSLTRAQKLQKRVASVGFKWPNIQGILDKMEEEIGELRDELDREEENGDRHLDRLRDEFGDILFVFTKFGMSLGLNVEETLRQTNNKFERRFRGVESGLKAEGLTLEDATLEQMEAQWQKQKLTE